jgi:hypothetical protein
MKISQPGDAAERAADWRAARAMSKGGPAVGDRAAPGARAGSTPAPFGLGAGAALAADARAYFEPRFGADLSAVRVHTGERAEQAAADVRARAFAYGSHVVFGAGNYAPTSIAGRQLLAHELAHTLQPAVATTVLRQADDVEPEDRRGLRTALAALVPAVLHRIEQSVARGYGGLYEFETRTPDGRIRMGGPGTTEETLNQRRTRLLELAADLRAVAAVLDGGSMPESWWTAVTTRSTGGRGITIGGFGERIEALALIYQQYAEEAGRDATVAFFNYGYIQPLSAATAGTRPFDTGIDVIAPDPDRPERVMRMFGSTPILTDPETGRPTSSPIHRVFRDERGYYYLTGPAWLGPHRRVDLDAEALGLGREP